ncbi:DUF5689 domain-containing protein [Flavobacterium agrisoli]|uniref:Choice-of-anchor J domain-containing protein n=1 Tax=Flavobacterium agrisoli TaxID=2793066 RepID=A0A934PLF6_9FLAO|nr:DUF5689 domain-containing protein [Flavobacterium agrisoli]MBK0369757.1 choice-of-anchor J domain-containing protein [Flavobacterium agrisoli]
MKKGSFITSLIWIGLVMSCDSKEPQIPELTCTQPDLVVTKTVSDIQNQSSATAKEYLFDDVIQAYVVSSDESGNFFKTIHLQTLPSEREPVRGFSVGVDASNTYVNYRVGNKVYVKLQDQFTDIYFGGLRIGSLYVNSYGEAAVGRVAQNDIKKVLNASCVTVTEENLVRKFSIESVANDANLNTLVEIDEVQFEDLALGRHFYEELNDVGGATNWKLLDKTGNHLIFRTSSYARFAGAIVPEGSGTVRGVLTKFGADYQLLARNEADIKITDGRSVPFFTEDFQTVENNVTLKLPGWANIAQIGTKFWKGIVKSGNGCTEFNIASTKNALNAAWLITPKIDMDVYKKEVLTFRTAQHHLDVDSPLNSLEILVSTNFDGLNVAKATWIPLQAKLPTQATPWYQFVGSGSIDLSSYTGTINIAFKYNGSGKDLALDGTFQLDDVQIFGNK